MADKPMFIVASDCHLSRYDSAWRGRAIYGDAAHGFNQCVDEAVARGLDLICAGDLQDEALINPRPVCTLAAAAKRLAAAGLVCGYVKGNHDDCDPPWPSAVDDQVFRHLHRKVLRFGDTIVRGLDFQTRANLPGELERIAEKGDTDVLVCHQAWEELLGFEGRAHGSLSMIENVRLVITGDLHKFLFRQVEKQAAGQLTLMGVLSPGATVMTAIDEPTQHFCHIVYDDLSHEPVPLKSRKVLRLGDLRTPADLERALARTADEVPKLRLAAAEDEVPPEIVAPIVHFRIARDLSEAGRRFADVCGKSAHLFEQLIPSEARKTEETAAVGAGSLLDAVDACDAPNEVKELLRRLYQSPDADTDFAEIAKWEEEMLHAPD